MGIAFRYVSRELLAVFFVTAVVLLVIALGGRFMGYLQDAALGKHSADALLKIMALRVPGVSAADVAVLVLHRARADRCASVRGSGNDGARDERQFAAAGDGVDRRQRARRCVGRRRICRRRSRRMRLGALERFLLSERVEREFETMTPGVFHTLQRRRACDVFGSRRRPTSGNCRACSSLRKWQGHSVTIWAQRGTQYIDAITGSRFMLLARRSTLRRRDRPDAVSCGQVRNAESADRTTRSGRLPTSKSTRSRRANCGATIRVRRRNCIGGLRLPLMTLIAVPIGFVLGARAAARRSVCADRAGGACVPRRITSLLLVNRNALAERTFVERRRHVAGARGVCGRRRTVAAAPESTARGLMR